MPNVAMATSPAAEPVTGPEAAASFTQVPNDVLRDPGLSPSAKAVYAVVLSYAWQDGACWAEQGRLAWEAGMSVRTLQAKLDELVGRGLLEVRHRRVKGGTTNAYVPKRRAARRRPGGAQAPRVPTQNLRHPTQDLRTPTQDLRTNNTHEEDPNPTPPPTPLRAPTGGGVEKENGNGNGNGEAPASRMTWVREVECPECGAEPGARCEGMPRGRNHRRRWATREEAAAADEADRAEREGMERVYAETASWQRQREAEAAAAAPPATREEVRAMLREFGRGRATGRDTAAPCPPGAGAAHCSARHGGGAP